MELVIDTDESTPLLARLIGPIKKAVLCGKLRPGDALPSIRQLANDLQLSSRAVARAYRLLELDSILRSTGRGTFVHPDAKANSKRIGWSWCPLS